MRYARRNFCGVAVVVIAASVVLFAAAAPQAPPPTAITISGGGVGEFLDPNPCDGFKTEGPFGFSNFAVSATISKDGSVSGTFMCQVKGCVVIVQGVFTRVLDISQASGAGEQDVVFLEGIGAFVDLTAEFGGPGLVTDGDGNPITFPFCVELHEGPGSEVKGVPPGTPIARFFYTDDVVVLGKDLGIDDGFDEEEIRKGHIQINFKVNQEDIDFTPAPCPLLDD